jgi:4-amino-4-deoxy-L-arabinose transferase-like glycosyltransferase
MLAASVLGIAIWLVWRCQNDAAVSYLPGRSPASWIVYPNAPDILAHPAANPGAELPAVFTREFTISKSPDTTLEVRAAQKFTVRLNGQTVALTPPGKWKDSTRANIGQLLRDATNVIEVTVVNPAGPPALWCVIQSGEQRVMSDAAWQVTYAGAMVQPARAAGEAPAIRPGNPMYRAETPLNGFKSRAGRHAVLLVAAVVFAALITGAFSRKIAADVRPPRQIILLALCGLAVVWVFMFWNNSRLISPFSGFDARHHISYVKFVQEHNALPGAREGWETHQPPLYYVTAAWFLKLMSLDTGSIQGFFGLRALNLLIALGQISLVFASLRLLFPDELRRPLLGTVLAAFLPAHIYHAHYVSNETFLALLATASFYLCLRFVKKGGGPLLCAGLGAVVGAALLTKLSAILVAPLILAALVAVLVTRKEAGAKDWLLTLAPFALACVVVCGWYYARIWAQHGNPLGSGHKWAYGAGGWWQEPGLRSAGHYLNFGQALTHPLYSGFHSFWDGLYSTLWGDGLCGGTTNVDVRPPWDDAMLLAGYWLALVPLLCVILGGALLTIRAFREPSIEGLLMLAAPVVFGLGLVYFSLTAPGTTQTRASFGLMVLLPFCAWFVKGFDRTASLHRHAGFALMAGMIWWALTSFSTHFVSANSAQVQTLRAQALLTEGQVALAGQYAQVALQLDSSKHLARSILADCLNATGQTNEARMLIQQAVNERPTDAAARLDASFELSQSGRLDEAVQQVREAIRLAPDHPMAARELVVLLVRQGKLPDALTACRAALRIRPHDPQLRGWLADLQQGKAPQVSPPR